MLARLEAGDFDRVIAERLGGGEPTTGGTVPAEAEAASAAAQPAPGADDGERGFGDGIVSDKPLDEVILDYLVDKSRSRGSR